MDKNRKLVESILSDFEKTVAQLVLYCLKELPFPLGVRRTIDVLKGNRSAFTVNNELDKLYTFSILTGYTRDQLSEIIDALINGGMVDFKTQILEGEPFPVIQINDKGRAFLSGTSVEKLSLLNILADKDVPDIPAEDQDLFYKLKLIRRQLAEEKDLPSFLVCTDPVLRSICIKKPTEPAQLEKIRGIGKSFVQEYGKPFLYVIRQYITREKGS